MWIGLISYGCCALEHHLRRRLGFPGADEGYGTVLLGGVLLAVPLATSATTSSERPLMKLKTGLLREVLRERSRRRMDRAPGAGRPG